MQPQVILAFLSDPHEEAHGLGVLSSFPKASEHLCNLSSSIVHSFLVLVFLCYFLRYKILRVER